METPPPSPESHPLPPSNPSSGPDEKQWKVILHLTGLAGFIGPLIVWLVKKEEIPALDSEGRKVLNFQFSYLIYMIVSSIIGSVGSFLCIPMFLPLGVFVAWLVFTIIGAVKASNNEPYEFPLTIKML
jgi:uncharacterized Tic20 family protein